MGHVCGTLMLHSFGQTIDFSSFEFQWKCREMLFGMELVEDKIIFNKLRGLTGYQCRSWIPFGFGKDLARGSEKGIRSPGVSCLLNIQDRSWC